MSWFRDRLEDPNGGQTMSAVIAPTLVLTLTIFFVWSGVSNALTGKDGWFMAIVPSVLGLQIAWRLLRHLRNSHAR
jgi:uncharacterized membrane protein YjdF